MSKSNKGQRVRRAKWVSRCGLASGAALLAAPYFADAATSVTWTGASGSFGDASQWKAGANNIVPGAGSVAMIGNNGIVSIAGGNFTGIGTLNLGYAFTGAGLPGTGKLIVDSGAITFASDINIGEGNDGTVVIGGGASPAVFGTSTSNKNFFLGGGPLGTGNAEIDILSNGSLQINNHSGLVPFTTNPGASTINMSGGSIQFADTNNGNILQAKTNFIFTGGTIVNLAAGTITQLSGDHTAAILTNTSSSPAGLTVDQAIDTTYDGAIGTFSATPGSFSGRFTKTGPGMLTLGPDTTVYAKSSMTFNNGTVKVSKDNTFDAGSLIFGGGILDLNGFAQTGSFLSGNGTVKLGSTGGLTIGFSSSSTATFTGQIVGTGNASFTKTGTGLLILTASQNYTGATNISNGTIALTASGNNPLATSAVIAQTASGANIDVTALSGGLILNPANNQMLSMSGGKVWGNLTVGGGTTLKGSGTINGSLALNNANLAIGVTGTSADKITVTTANGLSLSGNSVITLSPTGTILPIESTLISYAGASLADLGHLSLSSSTVNGLNALLLYNALTPNSIDLAIGGSFWNTNGDGSSSDSSKWDGGVPNGVDASAIFGAHGGSITTPTATVTLNQPTTLGTLQFDTKVTINSVTFSTSYTVAGTAPNSLTMATSSGQASINVVTGSHTISAPVKLNSDTTVTITPSTSTLSFTGNLTATGRTITKAGAGKVQFKNVNAAGLTINAGTVAIAAGAAPDSAGGTSVINALSIPTGALDLTNNALILPYSSLGTLLSDTRSELSSGRLKTSLGAGGYALGYADNSVLGKSTFGGQSVNASNVLVGYTFAGDANIDGLVNALDFNAVASNFGSNNGSNVWTSGDFNYDGNVDTTDFTLLSQNFGQNLGVVPGPGLSALVPEPSLVMLAPLAFVLRRRRARLLHK